MRKMTRKLGLFLVAVLYSIVAVSPVHAQSVQLTPAQQQMLNALPPAERQQALDAIRQLEAQETSSAGQSINEPLEDLASSNENSTLDDIDSSAEPVADSRSRVVINFYATRGTAAFRAIGVE